MIKTVAKIDNQFVLRSHYSLTTNEQKLILFLVSKINPKERKDFNTQTAKITEIEKALSPDGKKWKSIYERVEGMCESIMSKTIKIPKGFVVNGEPIQMHEMYNWFSGIKPHYDDDGDIAITFRFSDDLKGFLLQLSQYVQIDLMEVLPLDGKHTIRMYQIFKAERMRTKEYKSSALLTYGVDELKGMLGLGSKYKQFQDFKKRVLQPIKREINEFSKEINIDYQYLKTRRKITAIEFKVFDAPKKKTKSISITKTEDRDNFVPTEEDIDKLTYAELKAYEILSEFGVYQGIIYRQILPTIKAGDLKGYEDLFVKFALDHFLKWTEVDDKNHQRGAFVKWWTEKKVFDSKEENTVYWKIAEKVNQKKEKMTREQRESRQLAKGIPHKEFVELYQSGNN